MATGETLATTVDNDQHYDTSPTSDLDIDLVSELSDVGCFSYAALCASELFSLYRNADIDSEYKKNYVKDLIKHTKQSQQVHTTVSAISEGVGIEENTAFVKLLLKEDVIEHHSSLCVPKDIVKFALRNGIYDSRTRVLTRRITSILEADWAEIKLYEQGVVARIKEEAHQLTEEEQKEKDDKAKKRKFKRYAMIGLATVGGGTLIGLTGGLAAPLLVPVAGTLLGASTAAALGSTAGLAVIGSLFGAAGAGLGGYKMNKRVGAIEEFEFKEISEGDDLQVTIAITGWLTKENNDVCSPWLCLNSSTEQYALSFDREHLTEMGQGIDYILTAVMTSAASQALKYTVLSGVMAAIMWPAALIGVAGVIDNPWSVCTHRTEMAGKQLAEILLSRTQGKRPVTLIGYSLGARVIYYCLTELARRKNSAGIIEDAVMLGAPVPGTSSSWKLFSNVVAGRIVNGYCSDDWLLRFLYRTASVQLTIAGLQPIAWQDRRMVNVDLTNIVTGHLDYREKLPVILEMCGVSTHAEISECQEIDEWTVVAPNKADEIDNNNTAELESTIEHLQLSDQAETLKHERVHPPTSLDITVNLNNDNLCIYTTNSTISSESTSPSITPTNNPLSPARSSHSDLLSVSDADSGFLSRSSSSCVSRSSSMATIPIMTSSPSRHKALLDVTADGMKPRTPRQTPGNTPRQSPGATPRHTPRQTPRHTPTQSPIQTPTHAAHDIAQGNDILTAEEVTE